MFRVDKLDVSQFGTIVRDENPSFSGIVAGECKGEVWVDDLEHPTLALVHSSSVGGFCILGEPEQQETYTYFNHFLEKELFPWLRARGVDYFEFSVAQTHAEKAILALFSDKTLDQEYEHTYQKSTVSTEEAAVNYGEYSIHCVDEAFLARMNADHFTNSAMIRNRILGAWGSEETFLSKGLAYAAVHRDEIVAVIMGTAFYNKMLPIDIETAAEHQRQGLAHQLTLHFADACVRRGLLAHWNCMESNTGSSRTALKAGFTFLHKRYVYWFPI